VSTKNDSSKRGHSNPQEQFSECSSIGASVATTLLVDEGAASAPHGSSTWTGASLRTRRPTEPTPIDTKRANHLLTLKIDQRSETSASDDHLQYNNGGGASSFRRSLR
ncbi:hypothetical protein PIB30_105280, partial [Stylosanthes scabra]|nr:hypothetical protein [Stylosanthes scabra]